MWAELSVISWLYHPTQIAIDSSCAFMSYPVRYASARSAYSPWINANGHLSGLKNWEPYATEIPKNKSHGLWDYRHTLGDAPFRSAAPYSPRGP